MRLSALPCFADLRGRATTLGRHERMLDGLRGLAALLVLAQHVFHPMQNLGMVGVWLFFILSGHLLVQGFDALAPRAALRFAPGFYLRRLARIVPMHAVTVVAIALYVGKDAAWIGQQLLLVRADYVLWTVKQEMVFYLLLPLAALPLLCIPAHTLHRPLALVILAALAWCVPFDLGPWWWDAQFGQSIRFFAPVFLVGMASGCFLRTDAAGRLRGEGTNGSVSYLLLIALMVLLIGYGPRLPFEPRTWNAQLPWALLLAGLMLWPLLRPRQPFAALLCWTPLRAIGVVGYSFYLLHMFAVSVMLRLGIEGLPQFLIAVPVTYIASCVTYSLIEKPCMALARRAQINP